MPFLQAERPVVRIPVAGPKIAAIMILKLKMIIIIITTIHLFLDWCAEITGCGPPQILPAIAVFWK